MKTNDTRLWNITVTWKHDGKSYKKEYIITAPTKEKAEQAAADRLLTPKNIAGASDEKYCVRDLGSIQERHSYYSSEIMSAGLSSGHKDRDLEQAAFRFAVMWGEEIGWREADQATSEADQTVLMKLKDNPDADMIVSEWAEEYLRGTASTAETFFKDRLTEYLGQEIMTVNDVLPVTDTEYSRIIRKAKDEAAIITTDARKQADEMLRQMASVATALQNGTIPVTHTEEKMPEMPETDAETDDIPEDMPEDTDVIPYIPEEDGAGPEDNPDEETTEALPETDGNGNIDGDVPDTEEPEAENAVSPEENIPENEDDEGIRSDGVNYNHDGYADEDDDDDGYDDEDEEEDEMPEEDQYVLADGPPDTDGSPEEPDTDENSDGGYSDEEDSADSVPEPRPLTEDAMKEILKGYPPEILEPLLARLRVTTCCSRTGRTGTYDGQTFFMRMYGGSAPLDPEDRSARYVDGVIAEAEKIDGKSALQWACEQCALQEAADT